MQPPPRPALGLATQQGRKGRKAIGPVPLSDHMRVATSYTGSGAHSGPRAHHRKSEGPKSSLQGSSLLLGPPEAACQKEGGPPTPSPWAQVQPDSGQAPACRGRGYITYLWVSCSVREGGAGRTEAPLSKPKTGMGGGGPKDREPRESRHRGAAAGQLSAGCRSPNGPQSAQSQAQIRTLTLPLILPLWPRQ